MLWGSGATELVIGTDSNNNTASLCQAKRDSFKMLAAKGSQYPSMHREYKTIPTQTIRGLKSISKDNY